MIAGGSEKEQQLRASSKRAWINVTTVKSHQRGRERDRERVCCLYKSVVGNIMPQSYPLPDYYLPGLLVHRTSIKHFDSKSNHSLL